MLHPILLDARADYMSAAEATSLLLAPVGTRRLVSVLCDRLGATGRAPRVLSVFAPADRGQYASALHAVEPRLGAVGHLADFQPLHEFEPADWLLFVDSQYCITDDDELPFMLRDMSRSRSRSTHLVAMARNGNGTSERVELADDGRVRRIQRYYDDATWPFMTAVVSSLVPVAALRKMGTSLEWSSLTDLRLALLLQGVPCRDVLLKSPCFDLTREADLLHVNERAVMDACAENGGLADQRLAEVHPAARLIGPVVLQDRSRVEAGAIVIGPTVVGAGARIGSNAVLAHALVAPDVHVLPNTQARSQALYGGRVDARPAHRGTPEARPIAPIGLPAAAARSWYPRVKLGFDFAIAAILLLLLSPLFILLTILIKLESRGSVFFEDLREGQGGTLFHCLKFRTMVTGSELRQAELLQRNEVDGPQFKLEKDPRLTRLGRWLRPMSLDELPQLINVLRGEMSLIGPRPSPFRENQTCVPWREARLSVRPGITGLWQVCRQDRRDGDFHQWIYFDRLYVQHLSFTVDLRILIATVLTRGGQTNVRVEAILPRRKLDV